MRFTTDDHTPGHKQQLFNSSVCHVRLVATLPEPAVPPQSCRERQARGGDPQSAHTCLAMKHRTVRRNLGLQFEDYAAAPLVRKPKGPTSATPHTPNMCDTSAWWAAAPLRMAEVANPEGMTVTHIAANSGTRRKGPNASFPGLRHNFWTTRV